MNRIEVRSPSTPSSQLISPSMLRITSRATRNGNARKMSVTRIRTSSNSPPLMPAHAPTAVPITTAMTAAARPMANDTRVPKINRL